MRFHVRILTMAVVALLTGFAAVTEASVGTCGDVCGSDCALAADLTCCANANLPQCNGGSTGPITLNSGADLNLAGHNLICFCGTKTCNGGTNNNAVCTTGSQCPSGTCTDSTGCTSCGTAVAIGASSSIVKNTATAEAGIKSGAAGQWTVGVDCNNKTGSRVTGIRVEATSNGLLDCALVDTNVIVGSSPSTGVGIQSSGVANTDRYHDNYLDNWYDAIVTDTGTSMRIDHNMVSGRPGSRFGISSLFASGAVTVDANFFRGLGFEWPCSGTGCGVDDHVFIVPSFYAAWSNDQNYCDPENEGCFYCNSSFCEIPASPFILP